MVDAQRLLAIALGLVVGACSDDGGPGIIHPGDAGVIDADPYQTLVELPVTINRSLDLLLVVDDSPSMADKQKNLADNLPNLIDVLTTVPGGLPDVHIGVVTTDMGTRSSSAAPAPGVGSLGQGGCASTGKSGDLQTFGAPISDSFISDIRETDGTRTRNYTGDLTDVFATMVRAGAGGCGFEQPLAAARAALDNNPENAGFLRPDALLAVVFVGDEDDCSVKDPAVFGAGTSPLGPLLSFRCTRFGVTCAQGGQTPDEMNQIGPKGGCTSAASSLYIDDVAPYVEFLRGLKADPRHVIVHGLLGTTTPVAVEQATPPGGTTAAPTLAHSCTYEGAIGPEVADPPVRLAAALAQLSTDDALGSVCQRALSGELAELGRRLTRAIGSPCLSTTPPDADPATQGLQPDCLVEDLVGDASTTIPACTAGGAPCRELGPDPVICVEGDHLSLHVQREQVPPSETITRMRCRVE
jgi:hypothetical protein